MESTCSQSDLDHLLVFGYASKIYRDDEKARWIDGGRHLIPLLGDSSILIDRYDGRGALVDIKTCESLGSSDFLTPEEQEIERLCDFERYLDYRDDEIFEATEINGNASLKGEEVAVHQSRNYAAFQYKYDESPEEVDKSSSKKPSRDHAYAPPPGLYIPHDLILPKTLKSHAIIEKTAKFIASHGTQMEIILKTKQAGNPMFNFLTFGDELNPYYKYLITALKTNAYKPEERILEDDTSSNSSNSDDEDAYLHPSLFAKSVSSNSEATGKRVLDYKPIGPSAYSSLLAKIQEMEQPVVQVPNNVLRSQDSRLDSPGRLSSGLSAEVKREMPTGETQVIIEKMASYVVKNGPAFETLANTKGDPRFTFFFESHPYHWYYVSCKEQLQAKQGGGVVSGEFVSYKNTESMSTSGLEQTLKLEPVLPTPAVTPHPNHENAINRMATLPAALIDKIEQLRQKTLGNRAKENSERESEPNLPHQLPTIPTVEPFKAEDCNAGGSMNFLPYNRARTDDDEQRRKAERKRKAALFLEKMKKQEEKEKPQSSPPPSSVEPDEVEIIAEVHNSKPSNSSSEDSDSDSDVEEIKNAPLNRTRRKRSDDEENFRRSSHKRARKYSYSTSESEEGSRSSRKKKSKKKKKSGRKSHSISKSKKRR